MRLAPRVAARSCSDCVRFRYDDNDEVGGEIMRRGGVPLERIAGEKPPCVRCPKIPKGVVPRPENAAEWSERNWRAWRHYCECRAVGRFPGDPIVRRNAGVISAVLDSIGNDREAAQVRLLSTVMQLMTVRGG